MGTISTLADSNAPLNPATFNAPPPIITPSPIALFSTAVWIAVAGTVCIVIAGLSFGGGYWVARTASDSEAVRSGQALAGDEGRAAVRLAELGQAKALLECSGPGWTRQDGFCYGTAKDGKTVGWRTK